MMFLSLQKFCTFCKYFWSFFKKRSLCGHHFVCPLKHCIWSILHLIYPLWVFPSFVCGHKCEYFASQSISHTSGLLNFAVTHFKRIIYDNIINCRVSVMERKNHYFHLHTRKLTDSLYYCKKLWFIILLLYCNRFRTISQLT